VLLGGDGVPTADPSLLPLLLLLLQATPVAHALADATASPPAPPLHGSPPANAARLRLPPYVTSARGVAAAAAAAAGSMTAWRRGGTSNGEG